MCQTMRVIHAFYVGKRISRSLVAPGAGEVLMPWTLRAPRLPNVPCLRDTNELEPSASLREGIPTLRLVVLLSVSRRLLHVPLTKTAADVIPPGAETDIVFETLRSVDDVGRLLPANHQLTPALHRCALCQRTYLRMYKTDMASERRVGPASTSPTCWVGGKRFVLAGRDREASFDTKLIGGGRTLRPFAFCAPHLVPSTGDAVQRDVAEYRARRVGGRLVARLGSPRPVHETGQAGRRDRGCRPDWVLVAVPRTCQPAVSSIAACEHTV